MLIRRICTHLFYLCNTFSQNFLFSQDQFARPRVRRATIDERAHAVDERVDRARSAESEERHARPISELDARSHQPVWQCDTGP